MSLTILMAKTNFPSFFVMTTLLREAKSEKTALNISIKYPVSRANTVPVTNGKTREFNTLLKFQKKAWNLKELTCSYKVEGFEILLESTKTMKLNSKCFKK